MERPAKSASKKLLNEYIDDLEGADAGTEAALRRQVASLTVALAASERHVRGLKRQIRTGGR